MHNHRKRRQIGTDDRFCEQVTRWSVHSSGAPNDAATRHRRQARHTTDESGTASQYTVLPPQDVPCHVAHITRRVGTWLRHFAARAVDSSVDRWERSCWGRRTGMRQAIIPMCGVRNHTRMVYIHGGDQRVHSALRTRQPPHRGT